MVLALLLTGHHISVMSEAMKLKWVVDISFIRDDSL